MDKKNEALKLALEALEDYVEEYGPHEQDSGAAYAITAIREALAEQPAQQQEPVAGVAQYVLDYISNGHKDVHTFVWNPKKKPAIPLVDLYTSPPASKPWVGLTRKDKKEIERVAVYVDGAIRLTEAKLREKNGGRA